MLRHAGDRLLLDAIRALPRVDGIEDASLLFMHADGHGLAGVLLDAWRAADIALPASIARYELLRDAARECDHAAHLEMLGRIDVALGKAQLRGAVLKGALLAERIYPRPAARPTSDIDLLVDANSTERAADALRSLGYEPYLGPEEEHFRRSGHHLHLLHPTAAQLELHFHAYRGFGDVLRSRSLLARSIPARGYGSLRVLAPDDELFYLAVHAAAHRFNRLGWLYDLVLLLRQHDRGLVTRAAERARVHRMTRPFAFAIDLLRRLFDWRGDAPPELEPWREKVVRSITEEPDAPLARSVTRFAYSIMLCEDWRAAGRYARGAVRDRLGRLTATAP